MSSDSVLAGLLEQSVLADTLPRRRAAWILLKALRSGSGLAKIRTELAQIDPPIAATVASEVRVLLARYGFAGR